MQHIRPIAGLREIIDGFDVAILDLWGCLHDGMKVYDSALDCTKRLKAAGRRIVIMSNAPRRSALVAERIAAMGLTPDLYDRLVASGEETWQALHDGAIKELNFARTAFAIMAERDSSFLEGLPFDRVHDPAKADFILAIGVEGPQTNVADFEGALQTARGLELPLICANPDLLVHRGGVAEICAGAIAQRYAEIGGRVRWFGKPFPGIYRRALGGLGAPSQRVLCVGDSLRTDVAGAIGIGAQSLFIAGGIHHAELFTDGAIDSDRLRAVSRRMNIAPDFAMPYLAW